jgi:hypothetical protein
MLSELVHPRLTDFGPTPNEVEARHEEVFEFHVAESAVQPFVVPYFFCVLASLFLYLCIVHTNSTVLYTARWPVAIAIISFQL